MSIMVSLKLWGKMMIKLRKVGNRMYGYMSLGKLLRIMGFLVLRFKGKGGFRAFLISSIGKLTNR